MSYTTFKKELLACRFCQEDFGFEPRPVVWGNPNAKIVQVSQAPSRNVNETGRPFDDPSGKRLREWYGIDEATFYNKDIFYMTMIAHCYPGKDKRGQDRRPPLVCAEKWLHRELSFLNNEIYIMVGRVAARFLYPGKDFDFLVLNNQELNGRPAYALPHPSPLNIKWFKDHPEFYRSRLPAVRKVVQDIVGRYGSR